MVDDVLSDSDLSDWGGGAKLEFVRGDLFLGVFWTLCWEDIQVEVRGLEC